MYATPSKYEPREIGTGSATRIYENGNGDTVRIDEISLVFIAHQKRDLSQSHDNDFVVTFRRNVKSTLFYPGPAAPRAVTEITLIGDFDSVVEAGGDFTYATWSLQDGDCEVYFTDLPAVGDTV